jgi:prepilin peptidase CpaA
MEPRVTERSSAETEGDILDIRDATLFILIGICAVTDLRAGRVYNKVTYPAILLGFVLSGWLEQAQGLESSAKGFLLAAVLTGGLALIGGLGGGDTKLLAAIGAIKGYPFIADVLFYSFLAGGAMALSVALWQGRLAATLRRVAGMLCSIVLRRILPRVEWEGVNSFKIPFGVAICVGALWAQVLPRFAELTM